MYTRLPRPGTHPSIAALLRRLGALLAGACALLALAAASPAMAATVSVPHYGPSVPPAQVPARIHAVTASGMPGWQITLIAAGIAVLAALLAVTADRARAARRHMTAPSP
jgi:cytochrome c oxidase assembly factor CtaG